MKNVGILNKKEFESAYMNKNVSKYLFYEYPSFTDGNIRFWVEKDEKSGWGGSSGGLVDTVIDAWVRPCLRAESGSFNEGDIFIFGTDLYGIGIRWVAISDSLLLLMDKPINIQPDMIKYDEVCSFVEKEFIPSTFTVTEIEKISKGTFTDILAPYNNEITISSRVEKIPVNRFKDDAEVEKIIIAPREGPLVICESAFSFSALNEIEGLEYCSEIKTRAFFQSDLKGKITLGNVKNIGGKAFADNNITSLYIKGIVDKISCNAFDRNQIKEIEFSDNGYILELNAAFKNNHIPMDVVNSVFERVVIQYDEDAFIGQSWVL